MNDATSPTPHILIFDSGLGGVSILLEIKKLLPHARFSYLIDNAAFPYGEKSDSWLMQRANLLFSTALKQLSVDMVVLACNTASTLFLDQVRALTSVPVIGVVPAIKPAAKASQSRTLGLLATKATLSRDYIESLHQEFGHDCQLVKFNGQPLVKISEAYLKEGIIDQQGIKAVVLDMKSVPYADRVDTMILGCTHFPILKDALVAEWEKPIQWIDSGEAIARRAQSLCQSLFPQSRLEANTLLLTQLEQSTQYHETLTRYLKLNHVSALAID